jgi:hypothetical protein
VNYLPHEDVLAEQASTSYSLEGTYDFLGLHNRLESADMTNKEQKNLDVVEGVKPRIRRNRKTGERTITAMDWTHVVVFNPEKYIGGGGFGHVFQGEWKNLPLSERERPPPKIVVKKFLVSPSAHMEGSTKVSSFKGIYCPILRFSHNP